MTNLELTGNIAASLVDNHLLVALKAGVIQLLVVLQLLQCLTEREGGRTPGVPGRSTAHPPRLAGLDTLQEVVVLRLLAGLLRPVEEVVLGESEPAVLVVARPQLFLRLIVQKDPREGEVVHDDVVELGVVDDESVAHIRLQIEEEALSVELGGERQGIVEGVTQPCVHRGHAAAPQGGVHQVLLDGPGEGVLPHTPLHTLRLHLPTEAGDELAGRQVGRPPPARVRDVGAEGDGRGRNTGLHTPQ